MCDRIIKKRGVHMLYKRIKDTREDNDLTQKEVAEALGIDFRQYSRYENGKNQIPVNYLIKLADFYHVSTDYLLGRE